MDEYFIRFLAGGALVWAFSLIGDVVRPKSFAGLFGAAPSVALVSLVLAIVTHDEHYVTTLTFSMVFGALALGAFSVATCQLLMRTRLSALSSSLASFTLWLAVSFGCLTWVT